MARNVREDMTSVRSAGPSRSFAQSVSTYVRPTDTRGASSGFAQLAKAVGVTMDRKQTLEDEREKNLGMMEGLALSATHDPAAIKAETMYPQASPAFMAGLRESQSKAWAFGKLGEWQTEYDAWEGKNSNDPTDYQKWLGDKLGEARSELGTDQFALAGAMPILQNTVANMGSHHTSETAKRVKADEIKAMRQITLGMMEQHDFTNDPTGEGLIAAIASEADQRVAKGLDGSEINQHIIDDALSYADAMNDTRVLGALATAHSNGTYKLNATQMKQVDDALLNINNEINAVARQDAAAAKAAKDAADDAALGEYTSQMSSSQPPMPPVALKKTNPELYKSMLTMRSAYTSAVNYVSPDVESKSLDTIYKTIYAPDFQNLPFAEKSQALSAAIVAGTENGSVSLSEGTVAGLYRIIGGGTDKDPKNPLSNTGITKLRGGMVKAMQTMGGGIATLGDENQLAVAWQSDYDQMIMDYDLSGKTPVEVRSIHNEVNKQVIIDLLGRQDTRLQILESYENNPALFESLGMGNYFTSFYDANAGAKAADELEMLTGGAPVETEEDEDESILDQALNAIF